MSTAAAINTVSAETLQYAPLALAAVTGVEQAAKGLPGETKAQIALGVLTASAQVGAAVPSPTVEAISGFALLIAQLVGILNASGVFTHSKAPAPVSAA